MKSALLVFFTLFVVSGSSSAKDVKKPSGVKEITVRCIHMTYCIEDAERFCPKGYLIVSQESSVVGVPTRVGSITRPLTKLTIACKS